MGKYKLLGIVAGVIFVLGLFVTAPVVVFFLLAVFDSTPGEAEVCEHLSGDLSLTVPDCEEWLSSSEDAYGDYYSRRLRCMNAAASLDEARLCDDMTHLGIHWGD